MDAYIALRFFHILGACVLIGTGSGIAFFMFIARKTNDPSTIAATARIVVIADYVFTLSAAIAQPITGALLIMQTSHSWGALWVWLSLLLYLFIGALWVPVIFIQKNLYEMARDAKEQNAALPAEFERAYRRWFWSGVPAFGAILIILYLMIAKP